MKDNKGQVLVAFIIFIPIIFMLMAFIFDIGLLYVEKRKIDNQLKDTSNYAFTLNQSDEEIENKMVKIIKENNDYENLLVDKNNNIITVEFKKTKNSLFSKILGKAVYQIETKYEAYNNNNQVIIRKGN